MESTKQFSIADIELFRNDEDVDFAYVKLWALGSGNNSHKNPISEEVLKECADTILGKFIIAKFDKFSKDTTTHVPDQSILGYIDKSQEVKFEQKDGKTFITVIGVISKIYATDVVMMFKDTQNQRYVSCEFSCSEGEEDQEGNTPILRFSIHGVTILGLKYSPSCAGAEMKVIKFADKTTTSLKEMAKRRMKKLSEEKMISHPIDKSKDSLDTGDWNGDKAKHDLIKEKNYKTLAKSVCLLLEDGWEDRKITALKYQVMNIKDGKWVYNEEGLSSALAYSAQHDQGVHSKVVEIQKKLGLYKEEKMAEENKEFSEDVKDKEEDVVMEKTPETSEPDGDEKKEEFSEMEKKPEENSEKEPEEDKKDEEKKFSLDSYIESGAKLKMLENETAQMASLVNELMAETSAEALVKSFMDMAKERDELKKFKDESEDKQRKDKFFSIISPAKELLSVQLFAELYDEGKILSLSELDGFQNKVKAFMDENGTPIKPNESEVETMTFASNDNEQTNNKHENVFDRIKNK